MRRYQRNLIFCTFVIILLLVGACKGTEYQWGWYEILPTTEKGAGNLKFLFSGIWLTVALSGVSIILSVILGLFISLPGLSTNNYVRAFNRFYVETFRSIPVLVLILWVYYGLPVVLGISLNPFNAGIVALALSDSAFEAEIFRAGIQSIERGQIEAADALGFNYPQKMRHIILPQAIRRILPPLTSQAISLIKDSSLVSVIAVYEMTMQANAIVAETFLVFEVYFTIAAVYLVLTVSLSQVVRYLEKRFAIHN